MVRGLTGETAMNSFARHIASVLAATACVAVMFLPVAAQAAQIIVR
jgi:hypothetical protein